MTPARSGLRFDRDPVCKVGRAALSVNSPTRVGDGVSSLAGWADALRPPRRVLPLETITCATRAGVEIMGRGHEIGTFEPGKPADILISSGRVGSPRPEERPDRRTGLQVSLRIRPSSGPARYDDSRPPLPSICRMESA